MYIDKYWEQSVGGSDDAYTFMDYLEQKNKSELSVSEIFGELGLDAMDGDFRHSEEPMTFEMDGIEAEIYYAIEVVIVIAALILECQKSGQVNLCELDDCREDMELIITYTDDELDMIKAVLKDYVENAKEYDIAEMMDEDELAEIIEGIDMLRNEL